MKIPRIKIKNKTHMYKEKMLLLPWQHKFKFTAAVLSFTSVDCLLGKYLRD